MAGNHLGGDRSKSQEEQQVPGRLAECHRSSLSQRHLLGNRIPISQKEKIKDPER